MATYVPVYSDREVGSPNIVTGYCIVIRDERPCQVIFDRK